MSEPMAPGPDGGCLEPWASLLRSWLDERTDQYWRIPRPIDPVVTYMTDGPATGATGLRGWCPVL